MKLLDQYIYAIGRKLPYTSRNEIKQELRSLLLDEIESTYGKEPSQSELEDFLKSYGSPRSVANRYKAGNSVIDSGYTDLFFMIVKIVLLAVTLGLFVASLVDLISGGFSASNILLKITTLPSQIFQAGISAIGMITLIFILMTHFNKEPSIDLDEDWSPKELKTITLGPKPETTAESIASIIFLSIAIIVLNVAPGLLKFAEISFEKSGLSLGHYINLDLFGFYLIFLSILWIARIIYFILLLIQGTITRNIYIYQLLIESAGLYIMLSMCTNMNMYIDYTSLIGFRLIFIIIAGINLLELMSKFSTFIKYYIVKT